jgi:uncharacterized membrane protein
MQIETSKTLGGVGAILMFLGVIPFISYYGIIELVGLILDGFFVQFSQLLY